MAPHLTDDEHVLAFDDALLDLGLHGLADFLLVVVAEGGVEVAIAGGDGGLHSALDHVAGEVGGLQGGGGQTVAAFFMCTR